MLYDIGAYDIGSVGAEVVKMRVLFGLVSLFVLPSLAQAAPVVVGNGDFESAYALSNEPINGDWKTGASGWNHQGSAGTWEYNSDLFAAGFDAVAGDRIGFVGTGGSMFQDLSVVIAGGADYSISALFANRSDFGSFRGSFGFYAGDVSNIIALQSIVMPGEGLWSAQGFTASAALLADYVGMKLGVIVLSDSGQMNFDNFTVDSRTIVNPIPAAAWLFGTAVLGGGFLSRRKKKTA